MIDITMSSQVPSTLDLSPNLFVAKEGDCVEKIARERISSLNKERISKWKQEIR